MRSAQASSSSALAACIPGSFAGSVYRPDPCLVRAVDRDRIQGRRDPGMPVHVEMRLPWLAFGFEQRRRFLGECNGHDVRTSLDRDARAQVLIDERVVFPAGGGVTVNNLTRSPSSINSTHEVSQSLDMLVAVARKADLHVILRIERKVISIQRFHPACPRAIRQNVPPG